MIANYLKLAVRLLLRNPFFTMINVAGLSIGLASFFVLWTYSQSQLRTDQFNNDYDRIFRLVRHFRLAESDMVQEATITMYRTGFASAIANEFTEIADFTRMVPQQNFLSVTHQMDADVFVSVEIPGKDKEFYHETGVAYADPNFLQFFSLPLISGDPGAGLSKPNTAMLSERIAKKYFGNENPKNMVIHLNDSIPFKVTGVFRDLPKDTHLQFDILLSTAEIDEMDFEGWKLSAWWGNCYLKLKTGVDFKALEKKINAINARLYENCPDCRGSTTTRLQPMNELIFHRNPGDYHYTRSHSLLVILSVLSFVVLALAWINYVTLSVCLLAKRRKEMGTRRVVGAGGRDLAIQFFVEGALINFISLAAALTLVQLTKNVAERLCKFYLPAWNDLPSSTLIVLGGTFVLGLVATCIYPVVATIRLKPVQLLKKFQGMGSPKWSNALVAAQYIAAISILVWVTTVYHQLIFVLNRDIGIQRSGVIVIDCPLKQDQGFESKLRYFLQEAAKLSGILDATVSKSVAGDASGLGYGLPIKTSPDGNEIGFDSNGGVDERFLPFYGVDVIAGRNFLPDNPSDKESLLISKAVAAQLGYKSPEDALGTRLYLPWHRNQAVKIIGVFEDYEFRPFLRDFGSGKNRGSVLTYKNYLIREFFPMKISVKFDQHEPEALIKLEVLFKKTFPKEILRWKTLDENINRHYDNERIARNQILLFTVLALGIACLGLLGMISNKVVERTKEIGVRKILGAKSYHIAQILVNTTMTQVIVAAVVGVPLSYMLATNYLNKYSERINIVWWHFALPVALLVVIMILTIAGILIKASRTNPVESLRSE
jgi:putative ABC transport system permease protein